MGAALVHEDKLFGVDVSYLLAPGAPLLLVALGGEERLFLSGKPSRSNARLTLAVETETP